MRRDKKRLERLAGILVPKRRLLILTHDNPDPDAIASAWILARVARHLVGRRPTLAYGGIIGRHENRAMIEVLRIPMRPLAGVRMASYDTVALVDSQPRTGNTTYPGRELPEIVFDHHPCRRLTKKVPFYDVREDYGATTTILYEYLLAAGLEADRRLATAVFHAIRSETQNLGREAGRPDARVFLHSFPLVDNIALSRIEHAPLPRSYFAMMDRAIDGTRIYGEIAVTTLGAVQHPDMVAQFADLVIRLEHISWALCMGRYGDDLLLSLRTNHRNANAGLVIRALVEPQGTAGGHDMIAGGKVAKGAVTTSRAARTEERLRLRLLAQLGAKGLHPSYLARSMG
jgi:nanoRNase/pAp phosphatase (c-di-AMP/oligoRNAs hydrolase)